MKKENLFSAFFLLIASIVAIQLMGCENEYVHLSTQAEHKKNLMEIRSLRKSLEMYKKEVALSDKRVKEAHENLRLCLEPKENLQACLDGATRASDELWDKNCKTLKLRKDCELPSYRANDIDNYRRELKNDCYHLYQFKKTKDEPSIDYD